MSDIPFDVLMKGPAAVAAWLGEHDAKAVGVARDIQRMIIDMANVVGFRQTPPPKMDRIGAGLAGSITLAVMIVYAGHKGMRGPARDEIAELVDKAFDYVESIADMPEMEGVMQGIRKASK